MAPFAVNHLQMQVALDAAQAKRWLFERFAFDVAEQQRMQRAIIAQANGLDPATYVHPFPAVPVYPLPATPAPAPLPPPALPPAAPVSAPIVTEPPPLEAASEYEIRWRVDPATGKLILSAPRLAS